MVKENKQKRRIFCGIIQHNDDMYVMSNLGGVKKTIGDGAHSKQRKKLPPTSTSNDGLAMIQRLREESFNKDVERRLESHPYIQAAKDGTLTPSQQRAFFLEQSSILISLSVSLASLAGHKDFVPTTITNLSVPNLSASARGEEETNLFQFLLEGLEQNAPLLDAHVRSFNVDEEHSSCQLSAKAQAYPAYWAKLALSNNRAAAATCIAVNFPVWSSACLHLLEALALSEKTYDWNDKGVAILKLFTNPIEGLDEMAASIIEKEGVSYDEVVDHVRLIQEYERMFWDGIYDSK